MATGSGVLAQEWVLGRRKGVTLFIVGDEGRGKLRARGLPDEPASRRRLGSQRKASGRRRRTQ